mmetsp:Transcript_14876/g.18855  ORF Transcript_14876/g.18855 Transcript_14876/m.18855 type:complete len:431 (+) Transcript_14876:157-1449(+)|eukprot:CAMPEP_0203654048 /NCGR_PEP_ID=MMETSP0088-20131115/34200_1 /ASSEMBLY_ACC=CAM_ASM_001087 /TAXON_ID=426623 /ORGANISM="Chaetoceros affinis, Strain CCMP159" /LENGTH=430 /DNA_ID=CAMNT_0050514189 /DNA_START=72 /DNA_END=1364 /DNA_ORIENTATION=+
MTQETDSKMDIDETPTTTTSETETKKNENVTPSASGESAAKYPDMELAQSIHRVTMMKSGKIESESESELMEKVLHQVVKEMENPSLYCHLASTFHISPTSTLTVSESDLASMKEKNDETMKTLEEKVEDAKENSGDMEVLDARFEVARFAAKSLSRDEALEAYEKVLALPKLSSGKIMDALMESSRIASFYDHLVKNAELVQKISKLADESGDWDRRNRVKIYSALTKVLARDIKTAASLLIDCIATFSCTEICSYTDFIVYTIITNILYLSRTELKKKIIDGPEILSVATDIPQVIKLVNSLYDCDYKGYLHAMVDVEPVLMGDRFLQPHCGYIMRELHVLGYKQFLDSYKSVTLESMAKSFGISVEFLDLQLGRFIAAGRLTAKIDKFGGVVETNRPDLKNAQYRDMIQQGDLLLNRIQKLARVVDI